MKKVFLPIGLVLLALLTIILVRTMTAFSLQIPFKARNGVTFDPNSVDRLSKAITFRTVSYTDNQGLDSAAFREFHTFLKSSFPLVESNLSKEVFSGFSLLYTWEGRNKSLNPVLLLGHQDVVTAPDSTVWSFAPFSGAVAKGFVWGRGTLDDKASVMQMHEAVEKLLTQGFQPERTLLFAFGHDEETGGKEGAAILADILEKRGVKASFILDEGMAITQDMVPMTDRPVALIGTSEKGQMFVRMKVVQEGGHASIPGQETAISILNHALSQLLSQPMKSGFSGSVKDFIRYLGPEMSFPARALFANRWLFGPVILNIYQKTPSGKALVSSTFAPTVLRAGGQKNVLPREAEAILNIRIRPGDSSQKVLEHLKKAVGDERVRLTVDEWLQEPTAVSSVETEGFTEIQYTIGQVYPEILVAPTLMLSSSDSRHYSRISPNIYRFAPIIVTPEDNARIHGTDERIRIEDYKRGIHFYYQLMKNCSGN